MQSIRSVPGWIQGLAGSVTEKTGSFVYLIRYKNMRF